jgi:ubiquinone/menaquinone biosynthesis C-methylase UbiE
VACAPRGRDHGSARARVGDPTGATYHPPVATGPMQRPETWDATAAGYAAENGQFAPFALEVLREAQVAAGDRVLDVACGPGAAAFAAAARGARVVAVDFSEGMISELRARALREGADVEALVMDARALDLPDGSFDVAVCCLGFMFFPDRARAFAQMRRVLRPGGRAVIATWGPIERRPLMKIGFDAVAAALPDLPRPAKGDLQDPGECVREMAAAGFADVRSRFFSASTWVASPEAYWRMMERAAAPLVAARRDLGEEKWGAAVGRILVEIERHVPAGGAALEAQAVITSGRAA